MNTLLREKTEKKEKKREREKERERERLIIEKKVVKDIEGEL